MASSSVAAGSTAVPAKVGFGTLLVQGLIGGAIAAVVNLVLYFGSHAAGVSYDGDFQPGVTSIPVPMIAISGLVMAIPATIVAVLLQRFTTNPARNYVIAAVVFEILSLGGPPGVKGLGTGAIVVMELMHVVAGLAIGGLQYRALKK